MRILLARIAAMFRKGELDRRLDDEIRFHLEMEAEANRRRGMSDRQAASEARRAFGGEQQVREIYRDQRGLPVFEMLAKDLRYGLRMIRRSPGFTAIAVLSLALGIGANTAIFTLIDAVMLRSLPVDAPEQLVAVGDGARTSGVSNGGPRLDLFSYPLYRRLREGNDVFTGLLASGRTGRLDARIDGGGAELIRGRLVSGNYFEVLGVGASLGRMFAEVDGAVVVISYDYWTNRFARDPEILRRKIQINGASLAVVGVGPRNFTGDVVGSAADVWIPLVMQPQVNPGDGRLERRDSSWLLLMGRLKPGVTLAQAHDEISALAIRTANEFATSASSDRDRGGRTVSVQPGGRGFSALRSRFSQPLAILMIVVGMVLLIACANVANLLLERATSRQKEISVRLAIGASRRRLVRQLLTESVLLAAMGGAAGWMFAWAASGTLLRLTSADSSPVPLDVRPNAEMLAFTAAVSLLTGILFGLAPALRSTRIDLAPALKENARSVTGSRGWTLGKLLVVAQVALSMLLLAGAGLFVRSLMHLETLDVGYSRENLSILRVDPVASGYTEAQQLPLTRRILDRLRAIPGVVGVTVSENGIFSGTESTSGNLSINGFTSTRPEDLTSNADRVGPDYFHVMGVPILAGRDFDDRDRAGAQPVAILNETMAKFYFGASDPVGQAIGHDQMRSVIVGVAKDMKEGTLRGPAGRRYFEPYFQISSGIDGFHFEIRTRGDAAQLLPVIRREMQSLDGNLKILSLEPVRALMDQTIVDERLIAQLSGFFGALALLLAATGLYGVMSYATSRRTNEIGLRMALGASRGVVIGMVLRETLGLVAVGIAIGLPVALGLSRLISSRLVGLSANDPATLGAAAAIMIGVAIGAGMAPAFRASRIDPIAALRQE